ncbi:MAG: hypothetical protein HYV28_09405 [Ignavibacteriales bacterium]|nr:hypothetical protein [Ignavibacteriales bacterium]
MGDLQTALTLRPSPGNNVLLNINGSVICRQLNLSAVAGGNAARVQINLGGLLKMGQGGSGSMDCTNPNIVIRGDGTFQSLSGSTINVGSPNGLDTALGLIRTRSRVFSTGTNFVFSGTLQQAAGNVPDTVNYFTINNAAGLQLNKNMAVNGNITFTSGRLYLGKASKLTLGTITAVSGTLSAANMIVADSGATIAKRMTAAGSFTFPVGDTSGAAVYLPVTAALSSGTYSNGYVSIKMNRSKHQFNVSSSNYLKRVWGFQASGISGYSANLTLKYGDADIQGLEGQLSSWRFNGSLWQQSGTITTASNQITITGLTANTEITAGEQATMSGTAILQVKAVLQGLFDENTQRMRISDTLQLYLASAQSPFDFIDSCSAVLDSANFLSLGKFTHLTTGVYYPVIRHRNSIETWGAYPFTIVKGSVVQRDFTQSVDSVFGSNVITIGSIKAMYAADVNQDGFVDFSDLAMIDNDAYNFTTGYVVTDVNGDAFVDFSDLTIADNNAYNFVGCVKPGGTLIRNTRNAVMRKAGEK